MDFRPLGSVCYGVLRYCQTILTGRPFRTILLKNQAQAAFPRHWLRDELPSIFWCKRSWQRFQPLTAVIFDAAPVGRLAQNPYSPASFTNAGCRYGFNSVKGTGISICPDE